MSDLCRDAATTLRERFERRLGQALVAEGLVSRSDLAQALEHQLVHGAHLATVLFELGLVDGLRLTELSGRLLGVPTVDPRMVAAGSREARKRLPLALVRRHRLIPYEMDRRMLTVATAEPWDMGALEEAAQVAGLRIEARLVAEVPLVRLLSRLYGVPMLPRFEVMVHARQSRLRPQGGGARPAPADGGESLLSEEAFTALYANRQPLPATEAPPPAPQQEAPGGAVTPGPAPDEGDWRALVTAAGLDAGAAPEAMLEEDDESIPDAEIVEDPGSSPDPAEVARLPVSEPAAGPIPDLAEAVRLLGEADSRPVLGEILARFALSKGERVALLVHHGGGWTGWTGAGPGVRPEKVAALALPSTEGSIFGLVSRTGAHSLGPLSEHPRHAELVWALGGGAPRSAGFFPVHFRGRVVFGVYLDAGPDRFTSPEVAEVLLLAQRVPAALEGLIRRRLAAA